LFYDHYEVIANEQNWPTFARPVQFSLAKNYRSHQGILSFASWVMQLLWHGMRRCKARTWLFSNFSSTGFPETVDKLDPEIGYIGGPKPIIFGMSHRCIGIQSLTSSHSGI
jgi:hypothetical protein